MRLLMVVVVMVVRFDSGGGLSGGGRGEVGLLLARVEHHRRGRGRGGVLLDRVHGGGGARVLQVVLAGVVVVVHVGRREVLELVVVMRVMGGHCRGATVVRSHHFCNIGSSRAAKSHAPVQRRPLLPSGEAGYQTATLRLMKLIKNMQETDSGGRGVWMIQHQLL